MHISGKIVAWLIVLTAPAAIVLTAKLVKYRNDWSKEVVRYEQINATNAQHLADDQRKFSDLSHEWERVNLAWGIYWNKVATIPNPGAPKSLVADGMGTQRGLDEGKGNDAQVVHGFQLQPDGTFRYVGPFRTDNVEANRVGLLATWDPRAGEVQSWEPKAEGAEQWHWRSLVPSPGQERFGELQKSLSFADQLLAEKQRELEIQTDIVARSQEQLKQRQAELLGDANDAKQVGLSSLIETEETARNQALYELDRLRRELRAEVLRQQALVEENRQLEKGLPQPKPAVADNPEKKPQ